MATIRLPLDLRNPRISTLAGNSFYTVNALTAHDFGVWRFITAVESRIYGATLIPSNLAGVPLANIGLSVMTTAITNSVRFTVSTASVANGATLNPASLTAETAIDTTVPGTANFRKDITFPASGSLATTVSANDLLIIEITRNGNHANDTLTASADLVSAWLQVNVN